MKARTLGNVWSVAALSVITVACSTPPPPQELISARQEVQAALADPNTASAGAVRMQQAQKSLAAAEQAYADRESMEIVRQDAYLALRNAQIAREQAAEARSREKVANAEAERNRVLLEARTAEAEEARTQAARNAESVAAAEDEAERLRRELSELKAEQTERGMVLTLGDVLFDTNQATIKPGAMVNLERVSSFLVRHPDIRVIIEGHADSRGTESYNLSLSERRAQSVKNALVGYGVNDARINLVPRGESFPVASNATATGQQQNRRVEIVFSDAKGGFNVAAQRL